MKRLIRDFALPQLLLITIVASSAIAQVGNSNALLDRVNTIEDGKLEFQFDAREGVWGDGRSIITFSDGDDVHSYTHSSRRLEQGPVRVLLTIRDGEVTHLKTRVGGRGDLSNRSEDMGSVEPEIAATALLHLAQNARASVAEDAIGAAVLADNVVLWEELLEIARDDRQHDDVREAAIFWLGQEAGDRVVDELGDFVDDDSEDIDVREHAIFALSQCPEERSIPALIRVAKTNDHPSLRKTALFWLAQHDDDRVVDLFEEILSN